MNAVEMIGRIAKDIDFRTTTNGKSVTNFPLAVQRIKRDETDFVPCVAWNATAEILRKYARKGDRIGVTGHLQTRKYEDRDGKTHQITEVIVESVFLLEAKKKEESPEEYEEISMTDEGDDLPF